MLAAALLVPLASCAKEGPTDDDSAALTTAAQTAEETEPDVNSVLAAMQTVDYGGYEFRIWAQNWVNDTLYVRQYPDEEMDGEPINDALIKRDSLIEEKYNIKISYNDPGNFPNDMVNAAKKSVMSGEDAADLIIGDLINVTNMMITNKYAVDLNTVQNVDMSQPWWNKFAKRDLELGGKMYFAISDITTRNMQGAGVILFNKTLFEDSGLELPYADAYAGTWTLDKYNECLKAGSRDLDGDGTWNNDVDQFASGTTGSAYFFSSGEKYVDIVDGLPQFVCDSARAQTVIDKLASIYNRDDLFISGGSYTENDAIIGDRMMMYNVTVCNLSLFTEMKTDFGLLPLPKYDESQESYYNCANPWMASSASIPITAMDTARTGMLLEALSAASHYTSTVAAYDVTIEQKRTRDQESIDMLRIAKETMVFDLCGIFTWGSIDGAVSAAVNEGKPFASAYEKQEKTALRSMQKTLEAMGLETGE